MRLSSNSATQRSRGMSSGGALLATNSVPWRMRTSLSGVKLAGMEHGLLGETGSTLVHTMIFQSKPNTIFHRRLTSSA